MFLKLLKTKKGNLVAQFVVLIIIAVILIFVVTSFGAKIWQAFFPNADKSTIKSFDAIFNVINTKAISTLDHDSTTMNTYLKDDYRIIFFESTGRLDCKIDYWGSPALATYYAPKVCTPGKQCLCLYKKPPTIAASNDMKAREQNLVKCYSFKDPINIDDKYFDLNKVTCTTTKPIPYSSYIFVEQKIYPAKKSFVYVIEDNDANKIQDAKWAIPACHTTDSSNPCYGKNDGDIVKGIDQTSFDNIYKYCQNREGVAYKSTSVQCVYSQGGDDCDVKCAPGDVTPFCGSGKKYSLCEDYNTLTDNMASGFAVNYISQDEDYASYAMCEFDNKFCTVSGNSGCHISTWDVYACRDSPTGTISATGGDCSPPWPYAELGLDGVDCKIKYLADLDKKILTDSGYLSFITSYDDSNSKCSAYMKKYFFDKQSIMKCKAGMNTQCDAFVQNKKKMLSSNYDCDLKFIQNGQSYWLTHYDSSNAQCDKDVKALFTTVSLCKTKTLNQ